jgi:hypothetical protein
MADVRNYIAMKEAGRMVFEPFGDKVVVKSQLYDTLTGTLKQDVEIMSIVQVKQQVETARKQVADLTEQLKNFEVFLADMEATSIA